MENSIQEQTDILMAANIKLQEKIKELAVRKAVFKALNRALHYSLEPGVEMTDIRQYLTEKIEDL